MHSFRVDNYSVWNCYYYRYAARYFLSSSTYHSAFSPFNERTLLYTQLLMTILSDRQQVLLRLLFFSFEAFYLLWNMQQREEWNEMNLDKKILWERRQQQQTDSVGPCYQLLVHWQHHGCVIIIKMLATQTLDKTEYYHSLCRCMQVHYQVIHPNYHRLYCRFLVVFLFYFFKLRFKQKHDILFQTCTVQYSARRM